MSSWVPPRCSHGHIILGCPHDDCPEQSKFLEAQARNLAAYEARQSEAAQRLVREALGLPL